MLLPATAGIEETDLFEFEEEEAGFQAIHTRLYTIGKSSEIYDGDIKDQNAYFAENFKRMMGDGKVFYIS